MKKLLLTTMIAALLILPMGGVASAKNQETVPSEAFASQEMDYIPGNVPAETDALQSMTPAIHAMILAMIHHDLTVFDSTDSDLSWETLYNMLSLYGQLDQRSDYIDEDLLFPVETAADFSASLFPDLESLGRIPADLSDRMTYISRLDSYRLVCGDDGLAQIQLESSRQVNGNLEITGALVYLVDGSNLARFHAALQPRDNMFGYTIVGLELV